VKNIKIFIITFILFLSASVLALAQSSDITVTYVREQDNSVTFNYEKKVPGSYTISVKLNNLQNAYESDYEGVINSYSGRLFTIKPTQRDQGITFSYSYSYVRGNMNPKVDTSFVYGLPFRKGKKIKPIELSFIGKTYFKDVEPKNWKAYRFSSQSPDTVYAIRKGIVVKIEDKYQPDTSMAVDYTSKQNSILIEHEDGSMAFYAGFLQNSFLVKEGDTVYPQTNLGILGKFDSNKNYNLSVQIYFFTKIKMDEYLEKRSGQTLAKQRHFQEYITPTFLTMEGKIRLIPRKEYVVEMNEEVLTKEFTKKELKNYKKANSIK
jgi:hypothetical protein